ncbi:MAG: MFS transporter [Chloroflexi bacterium]|nr:MFS transporter [Chloroflexota bacterium]
MPNSTSVNTKKRRFFYGYVVVAAGFVVMAIVWGTAQTFGVFFKPMLSDFGWTRAAISGAASLSIALYAVVSIVVGKLTERFSPRLLVSVCGAAMGIGYILMSQVNAIWQVYLAYGVLVGVGTGGSFVPSATAIARWFVKRRGLMTGIFASGVGAGLVLMPPVANLTISIYDWRTSFIILGIVTLVATIVPAQFLRREPAEMGLKPYGEDEVREESTAPIEEYAGGEATRTKQLWLLVISYVCFGFSQQAIMVHIVPHATDLGISTFVAANIMSVIGGLHAAGKIGIGGICDKIGSKSALIISFSIIVTSMFLLIFAKETWMFYLFAIIFGFAYGGIAALISPAVAELFGLRTHGPLLGIVTCAWGVGATLGPIMAGHIFDASRNYFQAFLVSTLLSVLGLVLVSLLKPTRMGKG